MMARAATAGELTNLRNSSQWSELYLAIHNPAVIYTARVNQVFTSYDQVTEVTYDGGSGTLGDVKPGMTMWVGSSAGAYDKGMVRIRKNPTATVFYIGTTSEIVWADNDYLTIIDDFELWPKHWLVDENVVYMDYDLAYSDQHDDMDPIPVMGPDTVLWLIGASVSLQLSGSDSWALGSTIASYAWAVTGTGGSLANETTATPTFTATAAGTFRVALTVTAANGKTATGYRYIYVHDTDHMPVSAFQLKDCEGDWESGGWRFRVRMLAEAGLTTVREQARVILFAKDYYGGSAVSIGPLAGYENVIACGRIDGESILIDPDNGEVEFTVRGPQFWLGQIDGWSSGLKDTTGTPEDWQHINTLTVDKAVWHLLHWRSTASMVMDIYKSGDDRRASDLGGPVGSLWQQLEDIAETTIFARPLCDRYGRLFVEIDPQMISEAVRASAPAVMTLLETDWRDRVEVERRTTPVASMIDFSGKRWDGSTSTPYFSRAPGVIFKRHGSIQTRDRFIVSDQDDANALAGRLLTWLNNKYPRLTFDLASNNRMVDIAPQQYCQVDIAAEDNLRGFACSAKKLVPRSVRFAQSERGGALSASIDFEGENDLGAATAVTVERPQTPVVNQPDTGDYPPTTVPDWPITPPGIIDPPDYYPPTPPVDLTCPTDANFEANGPFDLSAFRPDATLLCTAGATARQTVYWFSYILRSGLHVNKTKVLVHGSFEKSTDGGATWVAMPDNAPWGIRTNTGGGSGGYECDMSINDGAQHDSWRGGYFAPGDESVDIYPNGAVVVYIDDCSTGVVAYCDPNDPNAPENGPFTLGEVSVQSNLVSSVVVPADFWVRIKYATYKSYVVLDGWLDHWTGTEWVCHDNWGTTNAWLILDDDSTVWLGEPPGGGCDVELTSAPLAPNSAYHVKGVRVDIRTKLGYQASRFVGVVNVFNVCGPPATLYRIRIQDVTIENICAPE